MPTLRYLPGFQTDPGQTKSQIFIHATQVNAYLVTLTTGLCCCKPNWPPEGIHIHFTFYSIGLSIHSLFTQSWKEDNIVPESVQQRIGIFSIRLSVAAQVRWMSGYCVVYIDCQLMCAYRPKCKELQRHTHRWSYLYVQIPVVD